MNQKRQPAGVPVGGEFAHNEHDEATATLTHDGSYMYPPFPKSSADLISFYENNKPTDEHLAKFADGYGDARVNWAAPLIESADRNFTEMYRTPKERSQAHWDYVAELEDQHPTHMNPLFARDIAKAVQIHRFSGALSAAEQRKALDYEITMANGQRQRVGDLAERYLSGYYEAELA